MMFIFQMDQLMHVSVIVEKVILKNLIESTVYEI